MNEEKEKTVTITREEYKKLLKYRLSLIALEHMGVDKWEGYEDAKSLSDYWQSIW